MQLSSYNGLTDWPTAVSARSQYSLRAFATDIKDLDVDFENSQKPHMVTQVLCNCLLSNGEQLPEDEIWSWTLKKRLQALLSIAIATRGEELVLHVFCSSNQCGERIELPLDLSMFHEDTLEEEFVLNIDDRILTARLPNGLDQQQWLKNQDASLEVIAKKLVRHIDDVIPEDNWDLPSEWLEGFGEALENHDQLMTLQLNSQCPLCAQQLQVDVDLEEQLLTVLSYAQQKLLLDVHQLALAYHWTEKEILRLPPQRRDFYLMQLYGSSNEGVPQ